MNSIRAKERGCMTHICECLEEVRGSGAPRRIEEVSFYEIPTSLHFFNPVVKPMLRPFCTAFALCLFPIKKRHAHEVLKATTSKQLFILYSSYSICLFSAHFVFLIVSICFLLCNFCSFSKS